jgi:hypothetical protein
VLTLLQFRHSMSLVLNAVAACPAFIRRRAPAPALQQLGIRPSQRLLDFARQPQWCYARQRVRLLCCNSPLSTLACRLARAADRHEFRSSFFEGAVIARIVKRCFSVSYCTLLHMEVLAVMKLF